jgi:hypothetical protein
MKNLNTFMFRLFWEPAIYQIQTVSYDINSIQRGGLRTTVKKDCCVDGSCYVNASLRIQLVICRLTVLIPFQLGNSYFVMQR